MKCPACQENLDPNAKFCGKCGQRIPRCPTCGEPVLTRGKFCHKDGTRIPPEILDLLPGEPVTIQPVPENKPQEDTSVRAPAADPEIPPRAAAVCARCGAPCAEGRKLCVSCVSELRRMKAEEETRCAPKQYCARCGAVVSDGQTLCAECRRNFSGGRVRMDADREETRGSKKGLIIAIAAAAVVILLLAVVVGFFVSNRNAPAADDESNDAEAIIRADEDGSGFWFFGKSDDTEESVAPEEEYFSVETEPLETMAPETIPETEPPTDPPTEPPTEAPTEPEVNEDERVLYFLNYCDSRYLTYSDLEGFDEDMCRIARNGIYAKSGRMFNDSSLQEYYEQYDWYVPSVSPSSFTASMLNEYQNANLNLIMNYESEHGYR